MIAARPKFFLERIEFMAVFAVTLTIVPTKQTVHEMSRPAEMTFQFIVSKNPSRSSASGKPVQSLNVFILMAWDNRSMTLSGQPDRILKDREREIARPHKCIV
eukprot:393088_1